MYRNQLLVLGLLLILCLLASIALRRKQRTLGMEPSHPVRSAIRVGIVWVNIPILPLASGPLFIQHKLVPVVAVGWSVALLALGFVLSWAWWSVNVSLWRRWAARRGIDPDELQAEGESSKILWKKGHFFERTELDRVLQRVRSGTSVRGQADFEG